MSKKTPKQTSGKKKAIQIDVKAIKAAAWDNKLIIAAWVLLMVALLFDNAGWGKLPLGLLVSDGNLDFGTLFQVQATVAVVSVSIIALITELNSIKYYGESALKFFYTTRQMIGKSISEVLFIPLMFIFMMYDLHNAAVAVFFMTCVLSAIMLWQTLLAVTEKTILKSEIEERITKTINKAAYDELILLSQIAEAGIDTNSFMLQIEKWTDKATDEVDKITDFALSLNDGDVLDMVRLLRNCMDDSLSKASVCVQVSKLGERKVHLLSPVTCAFKETLLHFFQQSDFALIIRGLDEIKMSYGDFISVLSAIDSSDEADRLCNVIYGLGTDYLWDEPLYQIVFRSIARCYEQFKYNYAKWHSWISSLSEIYKSMLSLPKKFEAECFWVNCYTIMHRECKIDLNTMWCETVFESFIDNCLKLCDNIEALNAMEWEVIRLTECLIEDKQSEMLENAWSRVNRKDFLLCFPSYIAHTSSNITLQENFNDDEKENWKELLNKCFGGSESAEEVG